VRIADGGVEWTATIPLAGGVREEKFGAFTDRHGYASSTPAVDATGIYVYYGTAGLISYDHKGAQRWIANCGSRHMNFGSAASPILYKDLVIINADVESAAIIAFNKSDGKEVWRHEPADKEPNIWCTPLIVSNLAGGDELSTFGKRNELLGLDPATGKQLWNCKIAMQSYQCPSQVSHAGVVYAIGDHPGNAAAVRAGGRGEVTGTHKVWSLGKGSVVSSPIYHDGHLYWASEESGKLYCAEAASGKLIYEQRLEPKPGLIYASAVLAGDRIYYVSQKSGTYVVDAGPTFKLLARNLIDGDESVFNGSPAISQGRMLLRSNKFLYCVAGK
jgi:outer membrane protein assembly factor BamB